MVRIRLARGGAKKRPFYSVVVTDQRNGRDGRNIERVGYFNPVAIGGEVPLKLNLERIEYWQGQGAQASERVANLVKRFTRNGSESAPARAAPPVSKAKPKAAPEPVSAAPAAQPEAAPGATDEGSAESPA